MTTEIYIMTKDKEEIDHPYQSVSATEFLADNTWINDCQAFIVIGVSVDPDDNQFARVNIANSDISDEFMTFLATSLAYHNNMKSTKYELLVVPKDPE